MLSFAVTNLQTVLMFSWFVLIKCNNSDEKEKLKYTILFIFFLAKLSWSNGLTIIMQA